MQSARAEFRTDLQHHSSRIAARPLLAPLGMVLWFLAALLALLSVREALLWAGPLPHPWAARRTEAQLDRIVALYTNLQETLESGALPEAAHWTALGTLPTPWGELSRSTLELLRARGAAVLPTLRRLRELARSQRSTLAQARARSAQALAQAGVCAALVPAFGWALAALLPGVSGRAGLWFGLCVGALALAAGGALWMIQLAERARWGGLGRDEQPWPLAAAATVERFLALLRGGEPPDLAWTRAVEHLGREAPALARAWGASAWGTDGEPVSPRERAEASAGGRLLLGFGGELRRALQASVLEGRPCSERTEAQLTALQRDLGAQVDRELTLLATRTLKPLFLCIAPALLGLIGAALLIAADDSLGGLLGG